MLPPLNHNKALHVLVRHLVHVVCGKDLGEGNSDKRVLQGYKFSTVCDSIRTKGFLTS